MVQVCGFQSSIHGSLHCIAFAWTLPLTFLLNAPLRVAHVVKTIKPLKLSLDIGGIFVWGCSLTLFELSDPFA